MPGKHLDLDRNILLGGENASDIIIASQKATKTYIDTKNNSKQDKLTAGDNIDITNNIITANMATADLTDTNINNPTNGQGILYNSTTSKWENKDIIIPTKTSDLTNDSGFITKDVNNLTNYTSTADLNTALEGKADSTHNHVINDITDFPTKVSSFTNDAGYLTSHQDISGKQDVITSNNKLSSDLIDDTNKTNKFVTASEKTTWSGKQDVINDLSDIRLGATAGSTAVQPGDNISKLINDAGYLTNTDISSVFVYKGTKATKEQLPASGNKQGDVWTVTADGAEYVWNGTTWEYLGVSLDLSGYQTLLSSTNKLNADYIQDGTTNKVVTQAEKNTWSSKQDTISDLSTIRDGANAGSTAVQPNDLAVVATSGSYDDLTDKPSIPEEITESTVTGWGFTKNNGTVTTVNNVAPVNGNVTISIPTVPTNVSAFTNDAGYLTSHQDISGKQDVITSENKLSADLLSEGNTNKLVSAVEKNTWNSKQDAISDLATIRTNAETGATALQPNDNVSALTNDAGYLTSADLSEYQTLITSENKLSADLIENGSTNKTVTATEKNTWNNKQDTISDLSTIRTNAASGASAATTIAGYGDIVTHNANEFLTEHQDISGKADITDLSAVATSGDYEDLTNKPSIPTVTDTYSSTSSNAMSGKAVASAIAGKADSTDLSNYVPTTRTINSKALTSNIMLSASDVGALPSTTTIPTVTDTYSSTSTNAMSGKAVYSAVSNKADKSTSLSGYGIADAYTKSEIDGKLTGAMHYKGTVSTVADLDDISSPATGDMYNVESTGANYAYNGTSWDKLSENIDLSGYVPTTRTINGKALTGNITLNASDVSALPNTTVIPSKTSDLTNDDGFITGIESSDVISALGYTPYNSTNPNGYTSNTGTVTGITMNGESKGTYGVVDLGTVLTEHQDISGKQDKITSTNKLSADLITDGTTNKTVTAAEKSTWNGKQDSISDLATIRSNASNGASAYSTINGYGNIVTHDAEDFLSSSTVIPTVVDTYSATGTDAVSGKGVKAALDTLSIPTITDTYSSTSSNGMSGKAVASAISGKADSSALSGYVPTSTTVNGKALSANITLSASDVSALPSSTVIPTITDTYSSTSTNGMSGKAVASALDSYELKSNVTSKGSAMQPVYFDADGVATAISYTIEKSVPSDANFSDTTYTAGTGLSLSGTTFNHNNSITAGTVGTSTASSGSTLSVPYITYDAQGHVTATGTRTHTITGFAETSHNQATNTINALTGYAIATASAALSTSDTLNTALGKLEYKCNNATVSTITVGMLAG